MKTLSLLAPDFAALDVIWRNAHPFVLWPVGSQSLLAHWMDEAVRLGVDEVQIYTADRPSDLRQFLEGGNYWSKKIAVIPLKEGAEPPEGTIRMDRLPAQPEPAPAYDSPTALLANWQEMQRHWLLKRSSESLSIDVEQVPGGGWVGALAQIHPKAKLTPPFWIGSRAQIGPSSEIGPNALIAEGCIIDSHVQVSESVILPNTYLGQNTRLHQAVAQGGILVDIKRACRVDIRESFIMAPVSTHRQAASILEKAAAFSCWLLLAPVAKCWRGQAWQEREIMDHKGEGLLLKTGQRGPLIIRRWPWLKSVFAGNLRWFGILPRGASDWEHLPPETAERLKASPAGIFSWADLHGCHDPTAPDEWIHAAYQVLQQDDTVKRVLRRKTVRLACLTPLS